MADNEKHDIEDILDEEGLVTEDVLNELGEEIEFANDEENPPEDIDIEDMGELGEEAKDENMAEEKPDESKRQFRAHTDTVYSVAAHPTDPLIFATSGGDDLAYIWSMNSDTPLRTLKGHTDSVVKVDFSFDGSLVATAGYDALTKIWDAQTGELLYSLEGPSESVECFAWHSKGPVIFSGGGDGVGWMWNAKTGKVMNVFSGHSDAITAASFTPDGKKIVTVSNDISIRYWDPTSAQSLFVIREGNSAVQFHQEPIVSLAVHPESERGIVLTGSSDGLACLTNIHKGKQMATFTEHKQSVEAVAFLPALQCAITGSLDNTIKIWDMNTMQTRTNIQHENGIVKIALVPNQQFLFVSCSLDHSVVLWDARSGEAVKTLNGHTDQVLDFSFCSDNNTILSCGEDKVVRMWTLFS
eukprot:TRINITY_DN11414_c0_g1_i1.p1 TRINITY_DN11414_c0_g1~~TRINITY_DN11414_c0_g1_i1.p1  ORF type:complete len:413 (+),score=97.53 TRINITY_DN11414_c0_g1_i1:42-1280(+)